MIVSSPDMPFGSNCTTRWPSPGTEEDFGNGEAISTFTDSWSGKSEVYSRRHGQRIPSVEELTPGSLKRGNNFNEGT